jgi:hypothetical protein
MLKSYAVNLGDVRYSKTIEWHWQFANATLSFQRGLSFTIASISSTKALPLPFLVHANSTQLLNWRPSL